MRIKMDLRTLSRCDHEASTYRQGDLTLTMAEEEMIDSNVVAAVKHYSKRIVSRYSELCKSTHPAAKRIVEKIEPLLPSLTRAHTRDHNRLYPTECQYEPLKDIERILMMKLKGHPDSDVQCAHSEHSTGGFTQQHANISAESASCLRVFEDDVNADYFNPSKFKDFWVDAGHQHTIPGTKTHAGVLNDPNVVLVSTGTRSLVPDHGDGGMIHLQPLYDRLRQIRESDLSTLELQKLLHSPRSMSRLKCMESLLTKWMVRVLQKKWMVRVSKNLISSERSSQRKYQNYAKS